MSKNLQEQPQREEVDLGQLFKIIGNLFQRLFDFVSSIFKGIYRIILLFLIHVFKRLKWYALAIFLGLISGYFLDKLSGEIYGANVFIETNYNASHQVYENMQYLHQLAYVDKDSTELARKLEIPVADAAKLKGFYIEPDIDENDKIKMFVNFKNGLDSVARAEYTYKEFTASINYYSFKRHKIGVASTDRFVYRKLRGKLVKAITDNDYLINLKNVTLKNFKTQDISIQEEQRKIDSLVDVYLMIRERESKKEAQAGSGTNFFMANGQQKSDLLVNESELIEKISGLEAQRRNIEKDLVVNNDIVSVISDFPDAGYDISEWTDRKTFVLPILFFILTFIGFLLIGFGQFLSEEDKKLKKY
ncbi:hypothetical protein [Algibacter luteus]|uniref:hypothetical protein n=1 Tax=Algibacter luteus TaxID=1178825 RepID=UPI0025971AF2|nr:hypothetical protein [Algibacter luteus]WJJ97085.1 hypothetical protein O5O44_01630 [Algibacter luteus]